MKQTKNQAINSKVDSGNKETLYKRILRSIFAKDGIDIDDDRNKFEKSKE